MNHPLLVAGIDIGSTYSKAVLLDQSKEVIAQAVRRSGYKPQEAAQAVYDNLLDTAGVGRQAINYVAATGYGRYMIPFRHAQITELTCHALAISHHFPNVRTILDIGGQDIKAISIDEHGRVRAFRLNDKCAAGTGAFLEKTARYLGLTTADIAPYALRATDPVPVSSVCAVFAESEVINHLAQGAQPENIVAGSIKTLAGRAVQLMRRVGLEPEFALAGGMTQNPAMVSALQASLGSLLHLPPNGLGQLNGCFGAALLGLRRVEHLLAEGKPLPRSIGQASGTPGGLASGRRRWSTFVHVASTASEPCSDATGCPVFTVADKPLLQTNPGRRTQSLR